MWNTATKLYDDASYRVLTNDEDIFKCYNTHAIRQIILNNQIHQVDNNYSLQK